MYKKKLNLWEMTSDIPFPKRAAIIIHSLPDKSKFKNRLAEKFLNKHFVEQMTGEEGLVLVKRFLEKELGEKELHKIISKWDIFEDCNRSPGKEIHTFVDRFDKTYEAVKSVCDAVIPSAIRALMLLRRAGVGDGASRNRILFKLDYNDREALYERKESQILEVLGGGPGARKGTGSLTRVEAVPAQDKGCYMINGGKYQPTAKRLL